MWTYEAPFAAVMPIKDHLAFYPDRVDAIVERPGDRTPSLGPAEGRRAANRPMMLQRAARASAWADE